MEITGDIVIFTITFSLKTDHDVIVPPFTSKVSRTIFLSFSPTYAKYIESVMPFKPFRVTVLKHDGRPLYAQGVLKGGEEYTFSVNTTIESAVKEAIEVGSVEKELFNARFRVEITDIEAKDEVIMEDSRLYKVQFKTPVLLQPPKIKKKNRFLLFPYVPSIFYSLMVHWNKNMEKKVFGLTGLKALYYFREVDYGVRPITVRYGKTPVRGFIGWTLFELKARKNSMLREKIRRLLDYANYFGVGKSRSIGFGEVEVKAVG